MPRLHEYSNIELVTMIRLYTLASDNLEEARRRYAQPENLRFLRNQGIPNPQIPSTTTILRTYQRLLDFGQLRTPTHAQGQGRPPINVNLQERILNYFERHPRRSTRQAARRFSVSQSCVWKLLNATGLHPYHYTRVHAMHGPDPQPRIDFCHWLIAHARSNIMWSDESMFTRVGIYNIHNEHWWSYRNPHKIREDSHQIRFHVNVWAAIINDRIIGPVWIEGRLTGASYLEMIRHVVSELMDDVPLEYLRDMYFQHDGCPSHYDRRVRLFLDSEFPNRWVGRGGPVNWPARSPDLTPLDFYLWSELKRLVYTEEARSREELKQRIVDAFDVVRSDTETLRSLKNNLQKRAHLCLEKNGRHFEHLLKYR